MNEDEEFEALEQRLNYKPVVKEDLRTKALKLALEVLEYDGVLKRRQAITAIRSALAEQPAQQQEPLAKVVSTAPERIWLDLGFDPEVEDEVSFDDLFDATWSHDNATGNGIEYVRADLAPASKPWVGIDGERGVRLGRR